ncbi:MAG: hypothetical protein J7K58_02470 [Euryarchaeota archaeon]|nr:hypothetical protein [Euryarchaeota archaeon]
MQNEPQKQEQKERKVFKVSYIVPFRRGGVTFIERDWTEGFLVITDKYLAFISKDKKIDAKVEIENITGVGRPERNPQKMPGSMEFVLSIDYNDEGTSSTALISSNKETVDEVRYILEKKLGFKEKIRLSFEERRLLMLLYQGINSPKDIAEIMNITESRVSELLIELINKGLVDTTGRLTMKGSKIVSEMFTRGAELERISYELAKTLELKYNEAAKSTIEILAERGFLPRSREEVVNKTLEEWLNTLVEYLSPIGLVSNVEIHVNRLTKTIEIKHINSKQAALVETLYSMYNVCVDIFTHVVSQFIIQYFGYLPRVINVSTRGSDLMITLEVIEPLPVL